MRIGKMEVKKYYKEGAMNRYLIIIFGFIFLVINMVPAFAEHDKDKGIEEKLKRWQAMTPEERDIIKKRYREWKSLSEEERSLIKENY
ncbi:MAG: DUF3106 domain-containing protein, partial [Nitrospira sp.]|nr:DUF3106 domain-containing protein [Nitrospira sp.]